MSAPLKERHPNVGLPVGGQENAPHKEVGIRRAASAPGNFNSHSIANLLLSLDYRMSQSSSLYINTRVETIKLLQSLCEERCWARSVSLLRTTITELRTEPLSVFLHDISNEYLLFFGAGSFRRVLRAHAGIQQSDLCGKNHCKGKAKERKRTEKGMPIIVPLQFWY